MSVKRLLGTVITTCGVLLAAGALPASAATPSPGWSLSSVAQPTNFSSSETQDAVEELVVSATGGTYELWAGDVGTSYSTAPIAWDASAQELQEALEAVPQIEAKGNITVSGGPGDATGSKPYKITRDGAWSGSFGTGSLAEEKTELTNGAAPGTVVQRTVQPPEAHDRYTLTATNAGSRPTSEGDAVTIADKLPPGLVPVKMEVEEPRTGFKKPCAVTVPLECVYNGEPVRPGDDLRVTLYVAVVSSAVKGTLVNEASVAGGGGVEVTTSETNAINVGPAPFGIHQLAFEATGLEGGLDMQAGDHPYGVTTSIEFNTVLDTVLSRSAVFPYEPAREVEDVAVELPVGFFGDPFAAERCPEIDATETNGGRHIGTCPPGSVVGTVALVRNGGVEGRNYPVYNMVPARGFPAELELAVEGISQPIPVYASLVPGGGGYRLRLATPGALRAGVEAIKLTVFGSPAERNGTGGGAAFLTNPSACSGEPPTVRAEVTAWEGGSDVKEATAYPSITGCNLLMGSASFSPSIEVQPETTQADTPSGYEVNLKVPQAPDVFGALATPDLENATVTLPAGVSLSPSTASGPDALEGCTEAQIDLLGTELGEGHPGGNGSPYDDGLTHASPGHCPAKSQIGTVEVKTPLLEEPLKGHVYVAQPKCGGNACEEAAEKGEVFGLYLEMAGSGVIIKQAGSVEVGGYGAHNGLALGQMRATFDKNPQFPFEDLKMVFSGGQRSALANPQTCGTATTTSDLEPWSAPESGPNATPSWPFTVTGCEDGFAPAFSAGTVTPLAGAFSPFTLTFSRHDREQDLSGLTVTMPPGLLGALKGVEQCPEPQASKGECGEASLIGHDQVAAGAGSEPLWETGRVYLTGPYRGAPFGLSIVTPAVAGPFNLGNVVVRATIAINPNTAQITTTSDPLPQQVDGVPLRIKTVNVTIDRPGFMFNPTNCSQQTVAGTITSAQGASVGTSSPFAVAGCATLPFAPKLSASVAGHASKREGAAFDVKITSAGLGQANIHKVDLTIPATLPSRLSTLQKACLAATFESNPAACSPESIIGKATIHTPVLNSPLSGPAYLVSRGGAAFPDVEFVLQGEGVTLILDGETAIKNGITYSRFETAPDAPFTTFETELPAGPKSILGAYASAKEPYNLCKANLAMGTEITGQNGAVIKQTTAIAATGCPPKLSITKTKVKGNTVLVTVKLGEAGTVKITGKGLKTTTKKGVKAGTHTITVLLTNIGRAAEKHKKKLKIEATLSVAGHTGTATATLKA